MNARRAALLLLACGVPTAAFAGSMAALRVGVVRFESVDAAAKGADASDLFAATLYRNFPGLFVVQRGELEAVLSGGLKGEAESGRIGQAGAARLQRLLGLDSLLSGRVMALVRSPQGGTLIMGARLTRISSGETLWADTRTVEVQVPPGSTDPVVIGKLFDLAVFKLVQDIGERLPREALVAPKRRVVSREEEENYDCSPPSFYRYLARDREWYYGVGKDPDTQTARDLAVINLAKQAVGGLELPDEPGGDRWEIAEKAAELLPKSAALAGWEQDAFERCKGFSYVLVRIEKRRVAQFINGDAAFRQALVPEPHADKKGAAAGLERRLAGLDSRIKRRLELLEAATERERASAEPSISEEDLGPLQAGDAVAGVRSLMSSGASERVVRAHVEQAETIFKEPRPAARSRELPADEAAAVSEARRNLTAGAVINDDFFRVRDIHARHPGSHETRRFLEELVDAPRPTGAAARDYDFVREMAFPLLWKAALGRKDWTALFKHCAAYLRSYPDGIYAKTAAANRMNAAKVLARRSAAPYAASIARN